MFVDSGYGCAINEFTYNDSQVSVSEYVFSINQIP